MCKSIIIKFLLFILAITLSFSVFSIATYAKKLSQGVTLLNPKQHVHGDGYQWDNLTDTLTLDGLNIDTKDEYGLKIPDGATVILKGDNYIRATKAALYIGGNVIIRGSGSLKLVGGDYGVFCNSVNNSHKLSITSGKITISSHKSGIFAEFSKVSLAGANVKIHSNGEYAVNVREFSTSAGSKLEADSTIFASYSMSIQATNLFVQSDKSALEVKSDKEINLANMSIKTGDSLSNLTQADKYSGEKAIASSSTFDDRTKSILFGENYSIAIDIIVLIFVLALLTSAIVVPPIIRKKRAEKIMLRQIEVEKEQKRIKKLKRKI